MKTPFDKAGLMKTNYAEFVYLAHRASLGEIAPEFELILLEMGERDVKFRFFVRLSEVDLENLKEIASEVDTLFQSFFGQDEVDSKFTIEDLSELPSEFGPSRALIYKKYKYITNQ